LTANNGEFAASTELETELFDASGRRVFHAKERLSASSHMMRMQGSVANPRLWAPDNPALYAVKASLSGPVQYRRNTRFGFRSFEAHERKLYLNGKPFYMMAALDQDFYPETVHSPTSVEFVRDMMTKAKRLGINVLRCHLKVAHPVYLDVADEVGMLIWTELPSWSDSWFPADHFSTMAAVRADKMFWEILIRDWNHPCIVLQTIINESWGINLKDASQRDWLRATFDRIKGLLAPLGRLVVDNSACEGNFHLKTDIEDFHQYYSMPDHVEKWDQWLQELSERPDWTFSPYGDAERTRREPLLVSEFGNWGLPKLPDELPWWFQVSFGDREVTRPAGVLERFTAYGFDRLFGTFNELAEESQWHQFVSLKYEIESIRAYDSIQGYVITGITDVHWEVNGLLDMWRNEKVYAKEMGGLQQPDLIMCKLPATSFRSGETVEVRTLFSYYSSFDLAGARVRWSTDSGAGGQFIVPSDLQPGSVRELQAIRFQLPQVEVAKEERLEIEVRLRHGHRLTENSYEFFVIPTPAPAVEVPLSITDQAFAGLADSLHHAGYHTTEPLTAEALIVTSEYDSVVSAHLQKGGRVLLIASSEDALPPEWPIHIKLRAGTELDGRWFSNYNWIRADTQPFSSVAFTRILGFESTHVAPQYVIRNIEPGAFTDVLSGITFGWLNNNSALAAQMQVGPGKLLITTYRFQQYESDPYSRHLLDSIIRYVSGPGCQPKLELPLSATISEVGQT
jgi:hypothetical protein